MIRKTSISTLVELLVQHFNETHTLESVLGLLRDTPVDPESMTPYLGYSEQHYTRNLVHRNEQFEMMVLCWDRGTISAIHNHCDQHCWMTAPIGKLEVQNFKTVDGDPRGGYCKLAQTDAYVMSPGVLALLIRHSRSTASAIQRGSASAPPRSMSTRCLTTPA